MATSILGSSTASPRAHVRGVAEALPPGERVLWEGAPAPRAIARHLLFVRPLAAYFAAMVGWWVVANIGRTGLAAFWLPIALQLTLVGLVLGGIVALAHGIAGSTTYAITDRRIVMRLGVVFNLTVNIPLKYVVSAQAKRFADGTGQIALQLDAKEKLAWIVLFPHVRPWRFSTPEPLLRGLTDPDQVGAILRAATLGA
jgi:Bacterial PH domain